MRLALSQCYTRTLVVDRLGRWTYGRLYASPQLYARRHNLDRSKYDPKKDEGSPAWRRKMARQEYLT